MSNQYPFETFLAHHKNQLDGAAVPPELWGALYTKLKGEVFDAGEKFQIVCEEFDDEKNYSVLATKAMDPVDEDCVFLIDHAWTFRPHQARAQLENVPNLASRLMGIFDIEEEEVDENAAGDFLEDNKENTLEAERAAEIGGIPRHESVDARLSFAYQDNVTDKILKKMWEFANTYTVRYKTTVDEEGMPLWFIMDEFGSRIGHSQDPNARVVPFYFVPMGIAFNVLFLVKPVEPDDVVTRDYCETVLCKQRPEWRDLLFIPWDKSYVAPSVSTETTLDEQFFSSGRTLDEIPSDAEQKVALATKRNSDTVKIFADDTQLLENLINIKFELVEDWHSADVLWSMKHFHDYKQLCVANPRCLVNQFPYENCLTVKDLLSAVLMQRNNGKGPVWFQPCYNLNVDLPKFVHIYQERRKLGLDNTWIVKPWNLARGLDMHVSNDLGHMIRLIESGPKIACKYIEKPLLFHRQDNGNHVKFDLRYIVFVKSLEPLEVYVYNNFWIRFAINSFCLDNLDDMETHFTVFNYADGNKILQMKCEEFVKQLETTYPALKWEQIQKKTNNVLKDLFTTVTSFKPPIGVAPNVQSRAMYGVDIMLQWQEEEIQPTLLECNFMPDCKRACNYYPDFADVMFKTLFLESPDESQVTLL